MKVRQIEKLGIPKPLARLAKWRVAEARKDGLAPKDIWRVLTEVVSDPQAFRHDAHFGELARELSIHQRSLDSLESSGDPTPISPRSEPAPYRQWGDELDSKSVEQMQTACRLPVAVRGALMPDAHVGYGLPIGGVLATRDEVIPYAVGVDIACRVKMTVLDLPPRALEAQSDRLMAAIEDETRFGIGSQFKGKRRQHSVLDEDWTVSPVTQRFKDKAYAQLGTSGSGNHFVEFGQFAVDDQEAAVLGLPGAGTYLALLSHSGSRGTGAAVCEYYSRLAMRLHPELDRQARHLAWLSLGSHEGQEYWATMNLMGRYASANHACIHQSIAKHLGAKVLAEIENHHNFAWAEEHEVDGKRQRLIVHRKGAIPAQGGVLGIIPGSMASPAYVVRGKGSTESMNSAAHGAGRVMSRKKAKQTYRWAQVRPLLKQRGVKLLSAGLDEVPFVYKNIDEVMSLQQDLVDPVGRFDPRIVKMAPAGERPED